MALGGVVIVAIERVGSTSVPALAAKPVIDVDIVVAHEHVTDAIAAMELAGFRTLGELGIPDRWALDAPTGLPRTNTYVVVDGSLRCVTTSACVRCYEATARSATSTPR